MLYTSENRSTGSGRSGSSDVSVSGGGSSGGVETGVPRNAVLEEMLPFIVESLKRIELRLHSLERRCDGFSEGKIAAFINIRIQRFSEATNVSLPATTSNRCDPDAFIEILNIIADIVGASFVSLRVRFGVSIRKNIVFLV